MRGLAKATLDHAASRVAWRWGASTRQDEPKHCQPDGQQGLCFEEGAHHLPQVNIPRRSFHNPSHRQSLPGACRAWEKANTLGKARAKQAGQAMPGRAALLQMRGDWDWNSKWYGAPTWIELSGMCWHCKAKPGEWRTMSADDRTSNSISNAEWLHKLKARNKPVSALFSLPGVSNANQIGCMLLMRVV